MNDVKYLELPLKTRIQLTTLEETIAQKFKNKDNAIKYDTCIIDTPEHVTNYDLDNDEIGWGAYPFTQITEKSIIEDSNDSTFVFY